MINIDMLQEKDQQTLWHPCSQMKDYETFKPLPVTGAEGIYLLLADGTKIIDASSSWWCKNLGHGHPRLREALIKQVNNFEHVILANTTNPIIVELSEKLTQFDSHLNKVCYASDGSSAVEMALKLVLHARQIKGPKHKTGIAALSNAYHGETLFALAVSDLGLYRGPYEAVLPEVIVIDNIPYVASKEDPLWDNCGEQWEKISRRLEALRSTLNVIIVEPILQGAGGMLIYSQDFLSRLGQWCQANDVLLIVDEIMSGYGRTGKMLAYQHANIKPDLVCLGKGLTSGFLPMSAVLMSDEIYQLFYNDYLTGESFLHSHTYSGNVLAAAVAIENLDIFEKEGILQQVAELESLLCENMSAVREHTKKITNIRYIGGVVAADIITTPEQQRAGYAVYQAAVKAGALLRPLGDTLYWIPPLTIKKHEVNRLRDITIKAIIETL